MTFPQKYTHSDATRAHYLSMANWPRINRIIGYRDWLGMTLKDIAKREGISYLRTQILYKTGLARYGVEYKPKYRTAYLYSARCARLWGPLTKLTSQ